jgi:hypothetical protein
MPILQGLSGYYYYDYYNYYTGVETEALPTPGPGSVSSPDNLPSTVSEVDSRADSPIEKEHAECTDHESPSCPQSNTICSRTNLEFDVQPEGGARPNMSQ